MKELFTSTRQNIDDDFQDCQPLVKVSSKLHANTSTIVLPIIFISVIFSLFTVKFGQFFTLLIGIAYPSYMTFKAINVNNQTLCKTWLTYWIVFGFLISFDRIISFTLFFFPGFYALKALFIIWLFYPRTSGASIIYEKFLKDNLQKLKINLKQLNISAKSSQSNK